jgi:uncharacterized membrane protein YeaQ/YmgE (transglycosylase-associated protein family)
MGIIGWIITGLIAGSLAQRFTGVEKKGCLRTMLLGVAGGLLGGMIATLFSSKKQEIDRFGFRGIFLALIGSVILCFVLGPLLGRRSRNRK